VTRYTKGRRLEWKTQRRLEALGYHTLRTAGSHGPFDVHAWSKREAYYIQVKANKGPDKKELRKLALTPVPPGAEKQIWIWRDYKPEPEIIEVGGET